MILQTFEAPNRQNRQNGYSKIRGNKIKGQETGRGGGREELPIVTVDGRVRLLYEPKTNFVNNGLSIAVQTDTEKKVDEVRYIDTGIKVVHIPKGLHAVIRRKERKTERVLLNTGTDIVTSFVSIRP